MTMPKKGSRKIVVDGKEYRYVIKPRVSEGPESNGGRLTVQVDGLYSFKLIENSITPAIVEKFIRDVLITQSDMNNKLTSQ